MSFLSGNGILCLFFNKTLSMKWHQKYPISMTILQVEQLTKEKEDLQSHNNKLIAEKNVFNIS